MKRLKGKTAIVTGGTRGIGRAICELFLREGASVIFLGTNEERGSKALSEMQNLNLEGETVQFFKVDVSSFQEVENFANEILKNERKIDILVNSAGITRDVLLMRMKENEWDQVINTNLKSAFNMTHNFLRGMIKERSGRIVLISSVIGFKGNAGQTNYASSKAGLLGFTKSLGIEVASRKITVNAICPGFIRTDMTEVLTASQKEEILKKVPMGRLGTPEEVAKLALFLASDEASYITGQYFAIDGGLTA